MDYVGPIANNTVVPQSLCTTGQSEQSTIHTVRNAAGMSDIQVVFPGWRMAGSYLTETPLPTSYTVDKCSLEYPVDSGNWYPVTKGGLTSWTVLPGINDYSDLTSLGVTIPNGSNARLYCALTGDNLPQFAPNNARALYTDEGCNRSTNDGTPKSVTDGDANRRYRVGPVAILGTMQDDSVAIIGDSQQAFISTSYPTDSGSFADHNRGDIASVIGGTYGYVNLGVGGEQWETALFSFANRLELAQTATIIIDQLGVNSFHNKLQKTEDTPLGLKRRALAWWSGKKVIAATTTPETTGAWTSADGSDQSFKNYTGTVYSNTVLPPYNAGLTLGGLLDAPLDRYSPLENATTDDKWKADGTVKKYTVDGLHLSDYAAHSYMAATVGSTWLAQIAALSATEFDQASVDFAATSGPTYDGTYATKGTFTRNDVFPGNAIFSLVFRVKCGTSLASSHNLLPNFVNGWIKQLWITTGGAVSLQNANATTTTSTATILDSAEHEVAVTCDGTTMLLFIDGVLEGTTVPGGNATSKGDFQIVANSSKNVSIREVTVWNSALWSSGYTPALFDGTEDGCLARWPLASDATGIAGPGLPTAPAVDTAITGALAAQEGGTDALAASVNVSIAAAMAVQETGLDSLVGIGGTANAGSMASQEGGEDATDISAAVAISGAAAAQESDSDALTASASVEASGSLSTQEVGSDISAFSGTSRVAGVLATQETGSDSFSGSGLVGYSGIAGAMAARETGQDNASSSGSVVDAGALSTQESGQDAADGQGTVSIHGVADAQEVGSDTFSGSGSLGQGGTTGAMSARETGADNFALAGMVEVAGSASAAEAGADRTSIAGQLAIAGAAAVQETGQDIFSAVEANVPPAQWSQGSVSLIDGTRKISVVSDSYRVSISSK